MDIFAKLTEQIIREQENIIGPVALEQARKVTGLKINWEKREFSFSGNKKDIMEKLVEKYRDLFGQVSVEFCRQAVKDLIIQIPKEQRPSLLQ